MLPTINDPRLSAPPVSPMKADGGNGFGGAGWFGIGYDAVKHKGNRGQTSPSTLSEDLQLRDLARRQLTSTHRDLVRNFAIAGWMVRKHLDYISTFRFRSKTGDPGLDRDINDRMDWWSRAENCDSTGRDSLPDLIRMWECLRTIDGDCLLNQLKSGMVQTIEGDRIQTFGGIPYRDLGIEDPAWVINGVWVNEYFRPKGYTVFRRPPQWVGLQFDRMIPARFATLFGYFLNRKDQIRGISPVAAAANPLRDVYEAFDYALLKAKISQFFAMQITRKAGDELGFHGDHEGETNPSADPDKPRYTLDIGKGPVISEMDPGDKIEVIESQTPSSQFKEFSMLSIMVALKALDLPYGFFDESQTNYSGLRFGGVQYEQSAQSKRHRLWMLLNKLTRWRMGLFIADAEIRLPANKQANDLRWIWSHAGVPLFDPLKEISADIAAVNAGFASPQEVCRARGKDFESIIDEIAAARDYAAKKGVVLSTALASVAADDPNKSATKKEDQSVEQDTEHSDTPPSRQAEEAAQERERERIAWAILHDANERLDTALAQPQAAQVNP
jgi:capsid protein